LPVPSVFRVVVLGPLSEWVFEFAIPVEREYLFDDSFPKMPSCFVWCGEVGPYKCAHICIIVFLLVGKWAWRGKAFLSYIHSILFRYVGQRDDFQGYAYIDEYFVLLLLQGDLEHFLHNKFVTLLAGCWRPLLMYNLTVNFLEEFS